MAHPPPSPVNKEISKLLKVLGFGRQRSEPESELQSVTPLDVIFSCCICNATFSEVYKGPCETVQMLSDGINPKERVVSRLFLASCCHVFCGKHLEGGGAPFHPAGSRPRAPCPVCKQEGDLYSIRGFRPGEYDSAIPACWFVTPPMKLDSSGKEMEALRFQYMSLITYSTQVTNELQKTKREFDAARDEISKAQALASQEHDKVAGLEQKNQELLAADSELQRFKSRLPAIQHYLKCIPKLVEQNELMRDRLASLGFQMHFEPLGYKEAYPLEEVDDALGVDTVHSRTTSNYTGNRSADTLVNGDHSMTSTPRDRPLKRQRMESPFPARNIHAPPQQRDISSRDIMPPPAKPLSRMKSIKKLWPTLRKKASHGFASAPAGSQRPGAKESGFGNTYLEEDSYDVYSNGSGRPPTPRAGRKSEEHYMTGALPVESYENREQSPPPLNLNGASTDFTFRRPVQTASMRPAHVPSEPSYIRLMDGLSHETGLDLGIMDPRQEPSHANAQNGHSQRENNAFENSLARSDAQSQKRWSLGHAFLHQSPVGSSSPGPRHPDPLRSNPVGRQARNHGASSVHPVAPAPQRSQQPSGLEESVVSPFFKSSSRSSRTFTRAGVNQRDDSSPRNSAAYPYQRQQTSATQAGWGEPGSLNALSFFNSPLNTRNEPILHHTGYVETNPFAASERGYTASNITPNGFIRRPDCDTFKHNDSGNTLSRYSYVHPTSASSFSARAFSSNPTSLSRATPLPASVPSIVPSRHAGREPRSGFSHSGLRSGRVSGTSRNPIRDNTYVRPARNLFSSTGRRSVKR